MTQPSTPIDTMSDDEFQTYGYPPPPFDVEDLDRYRPGGYHPVVMGDVLGDRFEVIHKLGYGTYATVWLCYDRQTDKWQAVKVVAASHSGEKSSELSILKYFDDVSDEELERNHICLPRDNFFIEGPNGRHLCIVMPLLGESLQDVWANGYEPNIIRHISKQMTEAMAFLHSRGICHGDFRPRNILSKIKDVDYMDFEQLMSLLPETGRLQVPPPAGSTEEGPGPHLPEYIYPCSGLPISESCGEILVSDFGEAYHVSDAPKTTGIPLGYAPPEAILSSTPLSFGADIWALGQTVAEIRLRSVLMSEFCTWDYISTIEEMLGPLPEPYRSVWLKHGFKIQDPDSGLEPTLADPVTFTLQNEAEYRKDRFKATGCEDFLEATVRRQGGFGRLAPKDSEFVALGPNERLDGHGHIWTDCTVPKEEAYQLVDLLQKIFKYDPAERASASELVPHPWFELQYKAIPVLDEDILDMRDDDLIELEKDDPEETVKAKVPDEEDAILPASPMQTEDGAMVVADDEEEATASPASEPKSPNDNSDDVFFDVEEDRAVILAPPQQDGIFNWIMNVLGRVVRGFLPRMYAGPMSLGDLCLYA